MLYLIQSLISMPLFCGITFRYLSYLIIDLDTTLLHVNYFSRLLKAETLIQDMYQWVKGKILSHYQLFDYLFDFSQFLEVLKLVVKRLSEIPRQHCVLFWHHCL
jgi:hypothetical protein